MDFSTLISNLGFPISAFVAAFFGMKYIYDKERESREVITQKITTLADSINENTKTLLILVENVKKEKEEKKEVDFNDYV